MIVGVIGSGLMGTGIAQIAAATGESVLLFDSKPGAAGNAVASIGGIYRKLAEKGKMSDPDAADARLAVVSSIDAMKDADLIIEAIVEDLEAKRDLFASLEAVVADSCILASNTSSISITLLAAKLRRPERVVGMHFFNPVPLMELVEVVKGLATSETIAEQVFATAVRWGKTPVFAKSTPGFIVNRVARPYYAEALRLLSEGAASPASIDAVMREAGGFRMGPFELMDLIGHDTNFAVTRSIFNAYFNDQRFTPSLIQQELVEAGRLGRKSGRGFFDYGEGAIPDVPQFEPPQPAPHHFSIYGEDPLMSAMVIRLHSFAQVSACAHLIADNATLLLTDGKRATERAPCEHLTNVVLVDYAGDFVTAKTLAVTRAASCTDGAYASAVGLLQAAGYKVIRLRDLPGLAVLRTMSMLANEAADAVNQGVCTVEGVNAAMRKGVNYPAGPLAWAQQTGVGRVREALQHLSEYYGEDRYRTSPFLREL
jgi:3-hydroxybutyryl-CoA dehydrogenase